MKLDIRRFLRKTLRWSHRWLGLIGGALFCLLAITGGIVSFRPQIASLLSPQRAQSAGCVSPIDWNKAEHDVEAFAHAPINRIYAPAAPDTRYRFRVTTDRDAIYAHVIYDACSSQVLGTANLSWLDWTTDLHHNLLMGRNGRWYNGWIGIGLLLASLGGIFLWLISNPSLQRLVTVRTGVHMPRDLHTTAGVAAFCLLLVASFTSLWLSFPQTMRGMVASFAALPKDVRAPRPAKPDDGTPVAGLSEIIGAVKRTIPDGTIQEIRMPEGPGNVTVRVWRADDFRGSGNNLVSIDRVTGKVVATDLYANRPPANRFVQAMTGLHYADWGGLAFRSIYGLAGFAGALLFVTGVLLWWLPKRRAAALPRKVRSQQAEAVTTGIS